MSEQTWRQKAKDVIYPAMREGVIKELSGRALRRFINAQYERYDPLKVRKFFPYRVWLDVLNAAMAGETEAPQLRLKL